VAIYCSGEGHSGYSTRVDAWLHKRGIGTDAEVPFYYVRQVPKAQFWVPEVAALVASIKAKIGEGKSVLIVIDTVVRALAGLDENTSETATKYLEMTEALVKGTGATVLSIAHASNKGEEKWVANTELDFRGSSGFAAGFDTTWTLYRSKNGRVARLKAKWSKDHDLEDLKTFYFTIQSVHLPDGRKGAAIELADMIAYDLDWAREAPAEKRKATIAPGEIVITPPTYEEAHAALVILGAHPRGVRKFIPAKDRHHEGLEPPRASGGVRTTALAGEILRARQVPQDRKYFTKMMDHLQAAQKRGALDPIGALAQDKIPGPHGWTWAIS
jgi:hypothetical protein